MYQCIVLNVGYSNDRRVSDLSFPTSAQLLLDCHLVFLLSFFNIRTMLLFNTFSIYLQFLEQRAYGWYQRECHSSPDRIECKATCHYAQGSKYY